MLISSLARAKDPNHEGHVDLIEVVLILRDAVCHNHSTISKAQSCCRYLSHVSKVLEVSCADSSDHHWAKVAKWNQRG